MTTQATVEHYKAAALSMLPKLHELHAEHLLDPEGTADQWDSAMAGFGQWLWLWQANLQQFVVLREDCEHHKPSIDCDCYGCTYHADAPPGFEPIGHTSTGRGLCLKLGNTFFAQQLTQARSNRHEGE